MGRLFWKFFAFVWLAQLAAMVALTAPQWFNNHRYQGFLQMADGPMAGVEVRAAATVLRHAGVAGLRDLWPEPHPGPTILAVDDDGEDVLHRPVPARAAEELRRLRGQRAPLFGVESVVAPDGRHYTLFSLRSQPPGGGMGPPGGGGPWPGHPEPWMRVLPSPPVLAATLVGSVLTALLLALYVAKPIRSLQRAFDAAAAGDLDHRVSADIGRRADELADLGRDFDRMAGRLKSSMESQRRLLHDVSHELRSPLARVQAAVGLLHEEPDRLAFLTGRIDLEVERIDRLVDELLTLSRLEDGGLGMTPQEVDMHELVSDIIQDVQFEAHDSGVAVTWEERDHIALQGVPQLLHRAIENVVRNAVKHGGHGAVHIETGLDEAGAYRLRVLDEGPGLAAAELEQLFMPFFRGRAAGTTGYGLGLAIARRAIEAHGGTIRAANRVVGGLCVEITLSCRGLPACGGTSATGV